MPARFNYVKPVDPADDVPRELLSDLFVSFEAYIRREKDFRGSLWMWKGMVYSSPITDAAPRALSLVIGEDASRESALADLTKIRTQILNG